MLHIVRQHAQSWVIKVVLAVIVAVFVFWGVEGVVAVNPATTVAAVDGTPIETLALARAEQNMRRAYQSRLGDQATPEFMESLNLQQQALEGLIQRRLLANRARAIGLDIDDREVWDSISSIAGFLVDGRFDKERYLRVLRSVRLTPAEFESDIREDLAVDRLQSLIGDEVIVSESEARTELLVRGEKVKLSFVRFPAADFVEAVELKPAQVSTWFEENQERFRVPERVRTKLLAYRADDFTEGIEIDEEAIVASYDDTKESRFTQPHEVKARHILKRTAPEADAETKQAARSVIEDLRVQIEGGADFAELASEHSDDPGSAARGGDLGFFGKGRMVAPFEEAAFSLEPGQISEIVESPFGFHLIQVEEVREERVRDLEEVRATIEDELRNVRAGEKAKAAADADRKAIADGQQVLEVAEARGIEVEELAPLGRSDTLAGIGRSPVLMESLFSLEPGGVSEPVDANGTIVIAQLEEKIPAHIPEMAAIETEVETILRQEGAAILAREAANSFLAEAREAGGLEAAVEGGEPTVSQTGAFSRKDRFIPGIGADEDLRDMAFRLRAGEPIADRTFVVGRDAFVVAFAERELPDDETLAKQVDDERERMATQRRQQVVQRYINELRTAATIEVYTLPGQPGAPTGG